MINVKSAQTLLSHHVVIVGQVISHRFLHVGLVVSHHVLQVLHIGLLIVVSG